MAEPTLVEYNDEPVFLADGDKFFANLNELAEYVYDMEMDPATAMAHPCDKRPPYTPDIEERVLEAWMEEADEGIECDIQLRPETKAKVAEVQALLEKEAPVLWWPRMHERVVIPAIKGPQ